MRNARILPLLALLAAPVAMASGGCEAPETVHGRVPVAQAAEPIVAGTIDTANDAVVAIFTLDGGGNVSGQCTGTIIATSGSTGYVLSAGHCKGSSYIILQADDYANCIDGNGFLDPSQPGCDDVFESTGDLRHPQYDDNFNNENFPAWDFLLIRFSGANANTPVIPADDGSANLNNGDAIEFSGYGLMNSGGQLTETSARRHATNNVETIYGEPPLIEFPQSWSGPGGPCSGDSGGPALKNGRVVGVTSFGDENCQQFGYSAWVEPVYAYIAAYIGAEVPPETCDTCVNGSLQGSGQCVASLSACQNDGACNALLGCFNGCTTDACYEACAAENQGGIAGYNALVDCAYCTACDATCNADFCDDPSSTSAGPGPTGSGVGVTTGSGDAVGATTGTGAAGAGGASGVGGGSSDGDEREEDGDDDGGKGDGDDSGATATDEGGCTVAAAGSAAGAPGGAGLLLVGAAALAASRRRRR